MAEIRKHKEIGDGLAAQVRAAMGDDIRPEVPKPAGDPESVSLDEKLQERQEVNADDPSWASFLTRGAERFLTSGDYDEGQGLAGSSE